MKAWVIAMGLCVPQMLWAQKITHVELDRTRVAVNEVINVRVDFDRIGKIWCGMWVNYGDGPGQELRVEQAPLLLKKSYAKTGNYTLTVEGKTVVRGLKTAFSCEGSVSPKQIVVFDPVAEEAASQAERELKRRADELAEREEKLRRDAEELARANEAAKRRDEEQKKAAAAAAAAAARKAAETAAPAAKPPSSAASGTKRPI